jgi:Cu-Zn family superoxide dismutase
LTAGCAGPATSPAGGPRSTPYVVANLQPTAGNTATGTVYLSQDGADVRIRGQLAGLKPNQEHGFHVHEKGDCSAPDATSAGGHLNPTAKPHGSPGASEHHAGDLPALRADDKGESAFTIRVPGTVLGSGAGDFGGKALVVHASPDDYTSQPAGNSGPRIACGVISSTAGRDASGKEILIPKEL